MDTHNLQSNALAILSQPLSPATGLGVLTARIDLSAADGWAQLLPDGAFSAVDGRPDDVPGGQWFLDGATALKLISQVGCLNNDRLIDYEHQTLNAPDNGQPAISAGWFNAGEMQWRDGDGLYIKPRWTEKARGHIKADEYRYLSAVFTYNKQTGTPTSIEMAALTNYPGLDGLHPVSALTGQINPKENTMEECLKKLLSRIGIDVTDDKMTDEQSQAALSAVEALIAKADSARILSTEIAALKGASGKETVDLTKYVPKAVYDEAVVEIATLRGENTQHSVDQVIKDAMAEGRAFAREEAYLTGYGRQQGVAALKDMLSQRPAIAALTGKQTDATKHVDKPGKYTLTDDDLAVLKATGISREDFIKSRDEDDA